MIRAGNAIVNHPPTGLTAVEDDFGVPLNFSPREPEPEIVLAQEQPINQEAVAPAVQEQTVEPAVEGLWLSQRLTRKLSTLKTSLKRLNCFRP